MAPVFDALAAASTGLASTGGRIRNELDRLVNDRGRRAFSALPLAAFQVIIYGRIGVITEVSDEMALTIRDAYPSEERHVTLGVDAVGRILVVAYTWRGDTVRIISVRKASRSERRQYEGKR